ncbi:hypothetical protein BH23PAT1_BH23PAT1_2240 [soil metagenome]
MKNIGYIIGGVMVLVVIIGGAMAFGRDSSTTESHNNGSEQSSSQSEEPQTTTEVDIVDFNFSPKNIVVKKGDTVTWTNQDTARHNVEFTSGSLKGEKGPLLAKSETYQFTFEEAGTFEYICTPHPYMKATITVEE